MLVRAALASLFLVTCVFRTANGTKCNFPAQDPDGGSDYPNYYQCGTCSPTCVTAANMVSDVDAIVEARNDENDAYNDCDDSNQTCLDACYSVGGSQQDDCVNTCLNDADSCYFQAGVAFCQVYNSKCTTFATLTTSTLLTVSTSKHKTVVTKSKKKFTSTVTSKMTRLATPVPTPTFPPGQATLTIISSAPQPTADPASGKYCLDELQACLQCEQLKSELCLEKCNYNQTCFSNLNPTTGASYDVCLALYNTCEDRILFGDKHDEAIIVNGHYACDYPYDVAYQICGTSASGY